MKNLWRKHIVSSYVFIVAYFIEKVKRFNTKSLLPGVILGENASIFFAQNRTHLLHFHAAIPQ